MLISETYPPVYRELAIVEPSDSEYTASGLANGKGYYFAIKPYADNAQSILSNVVMVIPGVPEVLTPVIRPAQYFALIGSYDPEEGRIAFIKGGDQDFVIYDINSEVSEFIYGSSYSPDWSPDGTNILFTGLKEVDGAFDMESLGIYKVDIY